MKLVDRFKMQIKKRMGCKYKLLRRNHNSSTFEIQILKNNEVIDPKTYYNEDLLIKKWENYNRSVYIKSPGDITVVDGQLKGIQNGVENDNVNNLDSWD